MQLDRSVDDARMRELNAMLEGESWRGAPGTPAGSTWKCDPWFHRTALQERAAKMREKYQRKAEQ